MRYLFFALFIINISCKNEDILSINVSNDIVTPKHYIVPKVNDQMIIDGKADESSWKHASFTDNFIDIEGIKKPKFNTKIKMLWDDNYLYVYSEMEETHIWGNLKQRDTVIYYNNDFEVFIDPSGNGKPYGEIEINALNTVWDLYLNKPYRLGGKADFSWNLDHLKSAVHIHGTLNNPNDIDSLWTVEMAIPLKPLMELKNDSKTKPQEGEQWRINFSRVEWDHDIIDGIYDRKKENGNYLKEYNWVWSNQKVVNMHEPEKWGFLQFTEAQSTKDIIFMEDEDILIKQTAFVLFKKSRSGELKYLLDNDTGFVQPIEVTLSKDKVLKTIFTKTSSGFEYTIESPFTFKIYQIDNHGNLKVL